MGVLNAEEAIRFFKSYGFRVDEKAVREWVQENNKKVNTTCKSRPIVEDDLYDFNDWFRYKGTAYEEGIDDETKIERLLDEVMELRKENERLQKENTEYALRLGIGDF